METVGFFGKIPAARDFVFHGLSAHVTEAWARLVSEWLAQARMDRDADRARTALASPVWRFLLPEGLPDCGITGAAGLMAGSVDGAGRVFPFCILLATAGGGTPRFPNAAIDRIMDELEPPMLGFMETPSERSALVAALEMARARFPKESTDGSSGFLLRENEAAAILLDADPAWDAAAAGKAFSLPAAAHDGRAECHWWHDGLGAAIGSQHLVTRGLPTGSAAALLFGDGWQGGWLPRGQDGDAKA